jgi:hypothetical protein
MARAQVSFEFFFVIAVVVIVTIVIGALSANKLTDLRGRQDDASCQDIAYAVRDEVAIAHSMASGYSREFRLPELIGAQNYSINISENLIMLTLGSREFVTSIQPVGGNVRKGLNTVSKTGESVVLNG